MSTNPAGEGARSATPAPACKQLVFVVTAHLQLQGSFMVDVLK